MTAHPTKLRIAGMAVLVALTVFWLYFLSREAQKCTIRGGVYVRSVFGFQCAAGFVPSATP